MAVVPVMLYPTIDPGFSSESNIYNYHGGLARQSLGGGPGRHPLRPVLNPFFKNSEFFSHGNWVSAAGANYRLLQDFTPAERAAGRVTYRALYVSLGDYPQLTDLSCYLTQPKDGSCSVKIRSMGKNTSAPVVSSDTTSPGGVFTSPTPAAPMLLGATFTVSDYVVIWVEHTMPAGAPAYPYGTWALTFTATGYSHKTFFFMNHLRAGAKIASVTTDRDNWRTVQGTGETFTISTTIGGAAGDPGQNSVYVVITGPGQFAEHGRTNGSGAYAEIGKCTRTALGTYTFQFTPDIPGYYTLVFDIGEHSKKVERNVVPA